MTHPWLVQHFRISIFSSDLGAVPQDKGEGLFSDLTGSPAEVDEQRANKTIRRRQGSFGSNRAELLQQPFRVDFTLLGPFNLEIAAMQSGLSDASLCTLEQTIEFRPLVERLFAHVATPVRLAFGALLFIPEESPADAYKRLQGLLPSINLDPGHVSDFILQVNRFVDSAALPGRRLNRMSTFNATSYGISMVSGSGIQAGSAATLTQLVVDVSSDAANLQIIDTQVFNQLCDELFEAIVFLSQGLS